MNYAKIKEQLTSGNSLYFRPSEGENRIRVVTEPVALWKSFNKATNTAKVYLTESEAKKDKDAKPRFMMYILNRDMEGQLQIAEFGPQIMSQFVDFATSSAPGYKFDSVPPYDMTLTKKGTGMDTDYTLLADRANTDILASEALIIKEAKPIITMLMEDKAVVDLEEFKRTDLSQVPF